MVLMTPVTNTARTRKRWRRLVHDSVHDLRKYLHADLLVASKNNLFEAITRHAYTSERLCFRFKHLVGLGRAWSGFYVSSLQRILEVGPTLSKTGKKHGGHKHSR